MDRPLPLGLNADASQRRRAWLASAALALPLATAGAEAPVPALRGRPEGPVVRMPLAPGGLWVGEARGRADGVLVTLAEQLAQRLGLPVASDLLPQQRLIQAFYETHEADVLVPGGPAPYGDHVPSYVPMFRVTAHVVTHASRRWTDADVARVLAQGASVVLARHVGYGESVDSRVRELEAQGSVTWVRDVGTALRMVAAQRVDCTLVSPTVAHAYAGPEGYRRYRCLPLPGVRPMVTGAAVSRRSLSPALHARVVAALEAMTREGDVARAFARHFPPEVLALESPAQAGAKG